MKLVVSEECRGGMLQLYLYTRVEILISWLRFTWSNVFQKDHHAKWPQMRSYLVFPLRLGCIRAITLSNVACPDGIDVDAGETAESKMPEALAASGV